MLQDEQLPITSAHLVSLIRSDVSGLKKLGLMKRTDLKSDSSLLASFNTLVVNWVVVYLLSRCWLLFATYSSEGFCRDVFFTVFYTNHWSHVTLAGILLTKVNASTETAQSKSCGENVFTHWFMGVTLIWKGTAGKQPGNDHTGSKWGQVTFTGAVHGSQMFRSDLHTCTGGRPFKPPTLQV